VSHTPGPWEFDYEAGEVSAPNGTVVLYPTMLPDETEEVANGHLVAAAPDLLAACEALMGYFKSGNDIPVDRATLTCMCDAVVLARAAIKKAKGQ
jgi:hypothetical protein